MMSERNLHNEQSFNGLNVGDISPLLSMNRVNSIISEDMHNKRGHPKPKIRYFIMDEETYEIKLKNCQIRPDKGLASKARVKTAWTIEVGIFKDYLKETNKDMLDRCFEADWNFMK